MIRSLQKRYVNIRDPSHDKNPVNIFIIWSINHNFLPMFNCRVFKKNLNNDEMLINMKMNQKLFQEPDSYNPSKNTWKTT